MSSSSSSPAGGVGFFGLLTIAFIVLKITGLISWSWWWVFSPIWITLAGVTLAILIIACIAILSGKKKPRRQSPATPPDARRGPGHRR